MERIARGSATAPFVRQIGAFTAAAMAVAAAYLAREALGRVLGPGLPPFILFYPTVMIVALLAGMGPGILATALASATTEFLIFRAHGSSADSSAVVGFSLLVFFAMGVGMSIAAEMYRRSGGRQLSTTAAACRPRMTPVFRPYSTPAIVGMGITGMQDGRCRDVNPAFLRLFGYTREEVLGRTSVELNLYVEPRDRERRAGHSWSVKACGCSSAVPHENR